MNAGPTLILLLAPTPPGGGGGNPATGNAGPIQSLGPWGWGFLFAGAGSTAAAPDLVAAVLARLRSYGGGSVAAAFGDTGAGSANKFQSDKVFGSPGGPWARVTEVAETPTYMTRLPYITNGSLQVSVFAPGRKQARDLGRSVMRSLDLAPLAFDDGVAMNFLHGDSRFVPTEGVGADGTPTLYHFAITFHYTVQRSL